jgi:hypothetical protein
MGRGFSCQWLQEDYSSISKSLSAGEFTRHTLYFDILSTFNSARVGSDAVLLRSSGLDLESDWVGVRVMDENRPLDQLSEWAYGSAGSSSRTWAVPVLTPFQAVSATSCGRNVLTRKPNLVRRADFDRHGYR